MHKKTNYLLIFLGIFFSLSGQNQTEKTPENFSYTSKTFHFPEGDYFPNLPFFTMCEMADGAIVFGDGGGVSVLNGAHLQKIKLPNNSAVTSLLEAQDGKIYIGGFNELGTLQKNKFGNYFYKSLISKFELEKKDLRTLLAVGEFKNHIIFTFFSELIIITGDNLKQLPSNNSFSFSNSVNNNYLVQDDGFGIYKLDTKKMLLELVFDAKAILNEQISTILPTSNPNIVTLISKYGNVFLGDLTTKIITKKNNIFEGSKKDIVTCAILGNNKEYIIGTQSSRILTLTSSCEIIKDKPLFSEQSNTKITGIFKAKNKNMWVLQSDKVNVLDYFSPYICAFNQGSVNDVLIKNKVIYLATDNGIYFSYFLNNSTFNFKKIENFPFNIMAIQDLDNDIIIVSNNSGLYRLENGIAQKIGSIQGFHRLTKIKNKKGLYLGSTNHGIYLVEKKDNNWSIQYKISGFDEYSRDILADYEPDTYWVCHEYKGVYKIHFNSDYSNVDAIYCFTNKNGFKSQYNINAFNWNKKIVFTTNNGIYTYDNRANKFELYEPLNTILDPTKKVRNLVQYNDKTWFIQDGQAGYFIGNNPKLYKDFFVNLKGSFHLRMKSIYPLDNNTVLFGTYTGLWRYMLLENESKTVLNTAISQVTFIKNQKKQFVDLDSKNNNIKLPYGIDILRLEFSSPKMSSSSDIQYSYKLENADKNWSPWQKKGYCEYKNLSHGNYTFIVKSKNLLGNVSKEVIYKFEILPKWYQTNYAFFLYLFTFGLFIYSSINYIKQKLENKNKESIKIWESEIEKYNLKKEKKEIENIKTSLEYDVIKKNKELANQTISLSMEKDFLVELKEDLTHLRGLLKSEESRKKITEIFQKLNQHKINEEYIELFDFHIKEINSDFFEKLTAIDSTLTKRELRLCTFIKMELTNKEIAQLFYVSTRTLENMRTKLRKKLNIQREDNFSSFLINLEKSEKK